MAESWSEQEITAIVADYFEMLQAEINGIPYNKSEHRRRLIQQLDNRSHASIERKHQNISAILLEMEAPYIDGYKPLRNYQKYILPEKVRELLIRNESLLQQLEHSLHAEPAVPTVDDILDIFENPPEPRGNVTYGDVYERPTVRPRTTIDYLRREASNSRLGLAGELLVINYERARLIHAGKGILADRVEHISQTIGDSAGYDIHSYDESGADRLIEAKTTKHGKETPFYITQNELAVSRDAGRRYWLYRVYRYGQSPRLFSVNGALDRKFILQPNGFIATGVA